MESPKNGHSGPENILIPPNEVRGMTKWQPELFCKTVKLPHVELPALNVAKDKAGKILKPYMLKMPNFQCVKEIENQSDRKRIVIDPTALTKITDDERTTLSKDFGCDFGESSYEINHTNFSSNMAMKSVFPEDCEGLTSSQIVGHITFVNLRDDLLPFKEVIGHLILDSSPRSKMVVTKINILENKFRNLDLEILAGDASTGFIVEVRENECKFKLDFSKVYWNPRLSTEHQRLVDLVQRGDVIFDVFGGVGPFAIPIAKKGTPTKKNPLGIMVHANDLNPSSFDYMKLNVELNKLNKDFIQCYNLDGGDFIKQIVQAGLEKYIKATSSTEGALHVIMNLPALATTFLHNFRGLLKANVEAEHWSQLDLSAPIVHVYAFSKADDKIADMTSEVCNQLKVDSIEGLSVNFVRNVAPNKDMFRITFPLSLELLKTNFKESKAKRIKLDDLE